MRLLPPFFMALTKFLLVLPPNASEMVWAGSWSRRVPHCPFCFIWQRFGLADAGIKNLAQQVLTIRCLRAFASAPEQLHFSFFSKKVDRSQPFQSFLPLARR